MSDLGKRGPLGIKTGKIKQKKSTTTHPIRKSARGEKCTLRLSGCNSDPETTVLCHIRRFGWAGMGQKPPDILGVFACSACHDIMDGRSVGDCSDTDILRAHGETLMMLVQMGIIRAGNDD